MKSRKKFYLVGYSFGSLITMEIARILENDGMNGTVVLIDGSPTFLKQLAISFLGTNTSDEQIYLLLIVSFVRMIFPEDNEDIIRVITSCDTLDEQIKKLYDFSKDHNVYSESHIRNMMLAVHSRMKMTFNLDIPKIKNIKSSITLIRPTEASILDIDEDYELSKFTDGSVGLKLIEGSHSSMLGNKKLIEIINDLGS